jgi:hypothetical protein
MNRQGRYLPTYPPFDLFASAQRQTFGPLSLRGKGGKTPKMGEWSGVGV